MTQPKSDLDMARELIRQHLFEAQALLIGVRREIGGFQALTELIAKAYGEADMIGRA